MSPKKSVLVSLSLGLFVLIAAFIVATGLNSNLNSAKPSNSNSTQTKSETSQQQSTIQSSTIASTTSSANIDPNTSKNNPEPLSYKNGTYDAMGSYTSPAGTEEIGLKLVLENDIVQNVEVFPKAEESVSLTYQNKFRKDIVNQVKGTKLDEVKIGKLNGSSLTPKGFNAALNDIKTQAKS